jgi:hypothetical protein
MQSQPASRISESNWMRNPKEMAECAMESARDSITTNPSTAVFSAFALGMGLGVGLAMALIPAPAPPLDVRMRDKFTQFLNEHFPWARG